MNRLLFILLLSCFIFIGNNIYSQCCCMGIGVRFVDENGETIEKDDKSYRFKVTSPTANNPEWKWSDFYPGYPHLDAQDSTKGLLIETNCGYSQILITIRHGKKKMIFSILNIPKDEPLILTNIPFMDGTFTININEVYVEWDIPLSLKSQPRFEFSIYSQKKGGSSIGICDLVLKEKKYVKDSSLVIPLLLDSTFVVHQDIENYKGLKIPITIINDSIPGLYYRSWIESQAMGMVQYEITESLRLFDSGKFIIENKKVNRAVNNFKPDTMRSDISGVWVTLNDTVIRLIYSIYPEFKLKTLTYTEDILITSDMNLKILDGNSRLNYGLSRFGTRPPIYHRVFLADKWLKLDEE
jgi:hypothetical protein